MSGITKKIHCLLLKQSIIRVLCLFGGNVKKVIRGRHSFEVVLQHSQDALNVLHKSLKEKTKEFEKRMKLK